MSKELELYKKINRNTLTTSEVTQSAFSNLLDKVKVEDFVIVENQRQKVKLVVQTLEKSTGIEQKTVQKFAGKVTSPKENILLAKQYIKENTYFLMKFESKNITFPDVDLVDNIPSTSYDFDKQITKQLIESWKYTISEKTTSSLSFLLSLHSHIAKEQALEWGVLRTGAVTISGTDYVPAIPKQKDVAKLIDPEGNIYEWVAATLPKMIKAQLFWDGNKRASFLYMNKVLIERAKGIVIVKDKDFIEFNKLLNNYYNDEKQLGELSKFMLKNCFYNTLDKKLIR